ncbi:hypothetical protein [Thermus antranikianii]|uniref:Uncharacterized protein n=1 Tax=Thermus antranikianii TaxID=88190 RepID=A0ABY7RMT5_9DEIN|nr:hypothetical protein [Thermus antranikianii]QWK22533.1 MAG: hypothetical protein KNN15_03425 [Thermus antranikianii]WCM38804.1 hypothetical protein GO600_01025 [Thermus antranikianii]
MEKFSLLLGLLIMVYNVLYGFRLKRAIPGGVIGERGGKMLGLIVFFALAYLVVLILTWSEPSSLLLFLLSLILLLGAVFVYMVLRLLDAIVASL